MNYLNNLIKHLCFVGLTLFSIVAFAESPQISLPEVEKNARISVAAALDVHPSSLVSLGTWYNDIVGAIDLPPLFDHSRIVVAFEIPNAEEQFKKNYVVAQVYGLNGVEETMLVGRSLTNYLPEQGLGYYTSSFVVTLTDNAFPQQVQSLIKNLRNKYKNLEAVSLNGLGVLIVSAKTKSQAISGIRKEIPYLQEMLEGLRFVQGNAVVENIELNAELYRVRFSFDPPQALSSLQPFLILDDLRGSSAEFLKQGLTFTTRTSFPKPFGSGPVPWRSHSHDKERIRSKAVR